MADGGSLGARVAGIAARRTAMKDLGDILMLFWIALGAVLAAYGIVIVHASLGPTAPGDTDRARGKPWYWLRRKGPGGAMMVGGVVLALSIACFAAAASQYQRIGHAADRRAQLRPLDMDVRVLIADMTEAHEQATRTGTRHAWRTDVAGVGPEGARILMELFPYVEGDALKSDLLWCVQEATGIDAGIVPGQAMAPDAQDDARRILRAGRLADGRG